MWLHHPEIARRWSREYGSKPVKRKKKRRKKGRRRARRKGKWPSHT